MSLRLLKSSLKLLFHSHWAYTIQLLDRPTYQVYGGLVLCSIMFTGLSMVPDSSKSSKSVTFTAADAENQDIDPIGMLIEAQQSTDTNKGANTTPLNALPSSFIMAASKIVMDHGEPLGTKTA